MQVYLLRAAKQHYWFVAPEIQLCNSLVEILWRALVRLGAGFRNSALPDTNDHCCNNYRCEQLCGTPEIMPRICVCGRTETVPCRIDGRCDFPYIVRGNPYEPEYRQTQPTQDSVDVPERTGQAKRERGRDRYRHETEEHTVQFGPLRTTAYSAQCGEPHEVCIEHHPADERAAETQEDLG
jgi:hypothetical protein